MKKNNILFIIIFIASFIGIFSQCQMQKPYGQGKWLYKNNCSQCHGEDGLGFKSLYPPLANSDYLQHNQAEMACLIRYGIAGPIEVNGLSYDQVMIGLPKLNDIEITNIINYINHAWGNDYGSAKIRKIEAQLESCE